MAGVNSSTLITKISEKITLNGNKYDNVVEKRISGISDIFKRIVTCPANVDTTIFRSGVSVDVTDSSVDVQDVKYIRVTNLDDTNPMNLSLQIAGGEDGSPNMSATVLVSAGESFVLYKVHDGIAVSDANATIVTALTDLESLLVDPLSEDIDVEVFIASI